MSGRTRIGAFALTISKVRLLAKRSRPGTAAKSTIGRCSNRTRLRCSPSCASCAKNSRSLRRNRPLSRLGITQTKRFSRSSGVSSEQGRTLRATHFSWVRLRSPPGFLTLARDVTARSLAGIGVVAQTSHVQGLLTLGAGWPSLEKRQADITHLAVTINQERPLI